MGILIRTVGDATVWTPKYFTNTYGETSWGGKHVSELMAIDLIAILDFCRDEGSRLGWNDANNGKADPDHSNPFHAELLGGYPHREWIEQYMTGVERFEEASDGPR